MDVIQGGSIEEEKDCQNTSWIPITPGKPSGSGSPDGAQNPGSGSCCSSTNSVTLDDTKSEIYGGGLKLPNDFSSANVQRWSNVSFGDLLALAHAGGTTSPAAEIAKDETACSVKSPFEHVMGSQSADDSLNFPSIPSQFEPVTPDLIKSKGRASNASNEVGQNKDESALVLDQSELQENNKPDNISPDKPRRRKHRPKVVIEGKPKRTRRPRTEKTEKRKYVRKNKVDTSAKEVNDSTICQEGAPKETPTVKRKYVRKNQVIKSTEKPSAEEGSSDTIDPAKETPTTEKRKRIRRKVNKITEEKPSEEGKIDPTKISLPEKPCRRSLNFELESLVSDETGSIAQSAQFGDGMEAVTEVTKVGVTHEEMRNALSHPGPPTPDKVGRNHDNVMGGIQDEGTGGTCRIDFADSKGLKRPYSCDKAQLLNARGVCFNSIQAYRAILPANGPECSSNLGVHFPAMYKKTRIEKGHSPSTFFIMPSVTNETNHHAPSSSGSPSNNSVTDIAKEEEMLRKKIAKKQLKMIDDIAERLQKLDLNRENGALVLYKRDGSIVPFVRKRKARPKVDVDDETDRVWKLLLLDINSEGIDGTDEDKEKWWEEERRVFNSRADSFIARMRLVQGDRRFSPWKGSVVDSVVGVFLTQNVSDHLSSSAFMSLAAHFPLKSNSSTQKLEQSSGCIVEEPEVCETDPNVTNTDSNEEKETVISSESSEISRCCIKSDSSSTVNSTGDQRETNDFPSSPSSVVSSETSTVTQVSDRADSSNYVGSTSFLKLLQMVGTSEAPIFSHNSEQRLVDAENDGDRVCNKVESVNEKPSKEKKTQAGKVKEEPINWDSLRVRAQANGKKREKTESTMDSLDWEAVRRAHVDEVAHTIRERGMNNKLAERIKAFLDRIVSDHGSLDLEWLRDVPPDKAKEYLLSVRGLGLKSVECVRLLTLHHLAFPVDTNVGRIAVRLGWVPLQPLPESLQLHLLELYPILESIQKFLWPRLCKLDQRTLYELHYHMITFGKVFCTKNKPNCNACPMRGECRHFASAFASARLALPAPEEKSIMRATENGTTNDNPRENVAPLPLPLPPGTQQMLEHPTLISSAPIIEEPATPEPEPIVEVPTTPEQEQIQVPDIDIEDACFEDPSDEIPMIELNMTEFTQNVKKYVENNMVLREVEVSNALVALTSAAASIPMPKLKNYSRLRTEHQVYELPDSHPLLEGLDKREPDDPCSYLLAIWTPGETANSMQPPERKCDSQESGMLCDNEMCSSCNSIREANSQTVRGTLLIPCRTAMRGSFPLNGTYFQVNEVFADHDSSLNPINVPRDWLWNLPRRTVYFGTSIPTIFKGLTTESIQHCFWRGFVCVRGFDQKTRAPRPLMARLHFPASKLIKTNKGKTEDPGVA